MRESYYEGLTLYSPIAREQGCCRLKNAIPNFWRLQFIWKKSQMMIERTGISLCLGVSMTAASFIQQKLFLDYVLSRGITGNNIPWESLLDFINCGEQINWHTLFHVFRIIYVANTQLCRCSAPSLCHILTIAQLSFPLQRSIVPWPQVTHHWLFFLGLPRIPKRKTRPPQENETKVKDLGAVQINDKKQPEISKKEANQAVRSLGHQI